LGGGGKGGPLNSKKKGAAGKRNLSGKPKEPETNLEKR